MSTLGHSFSPLLIFVALIVPQELCTNHDILCQCSCNALPDLQIHHLVFLQSATLSRTASLDPCGGLLEDTVVSCCEAVATYVCTTWFPSGNRLIGYGCWSLSPICELSLNLDIVSPQGKTHHKG